MAGTKVSSEVMQRKKVRGQRLQRFTEIHGERKGPVIMVVGVGSRADLRVCGRWAWLKAVGTGTSWGGS